jgi:predicted homoserine dehydrogenase-like protein
MSTSCRRTISTMLRELGGIVDYVVGSARPARASSSSPRPTTTQAHYLNYGKLGNGPLYSFYVPYHLTIFEVPLTVARAVEFGDAAIALAGTRRRRGRRRQDRSAGGSDARRARLVPHLRDVREPRRRAAERLLPMGLAEAACHVARSLCKDEPIDVDDVEPPGRLVHSPGAASRTQ